VAEVKLNRYGHKMRVKDRIRSMLLFGAEGRAAEHRLTGL